MILKKTSRSGVIRMAVLSVSVLAVSACADFGPHPIATGYKYQQEEYKSQPGPEPVIEKYTRRNEDGHVIAVATETNRTTAVQATDAYWDNAADELVSRLVNNLGLPAEPVYIAKPASAEETSFAVALRNAMRSYNIPMAERVAGAPFGMEYQISIVDFGQPDRRMISIQLVNQGDIVHEESGIYTVGVSAETTTIMREETIVTHSPDGAPVSIAP